MKKFSLALLLSVAFLLLSAAVIANIDGVPLEMRGAWLAKRFWPRGEPSAWGRKAGCAAEYHATRRGRRVNHFDWCSILGGTRSPWISPLSKSKTIAIAPKAQEAMKIQKPRPGGGAPMRFVVIKLSFDFAAPCLGEATVSSYPAWSLKFDRERHRACDEDDCHRQAGAG
jgi:hypothetical protein